MIDKYYGLIVPFAIGFFLSLLAHQVWASIG
jgi:hypothetical protein